MLRLITIAVLLATSASAQSKYQKDFLYYWQTVKDNYAYFDKVKTDWDKVKTIYQPEADTITSDASFVHLLERCNNELYNGHVFLNTNTRSSNRTVPTGADIKATYDKGEVLIQDVREGYNASICGLKPGMRVVRFNDIPVADAIRKFLPRSVGGYNEEM